MIESVAVRQRGAYDFEGYYNNLCALQNSCPLPAVKSHLAENVLDINGDRIRAVDWMPILGVIRVNKTLEFVAVRSYFEQTIEKEEGRNYKHKTPAIRSKEITYRLCKGLRDCLNGTPCLTCIELQGLPLRERDLGSLAKGIYHNKTLQHLSFEHSHIGDEGLETVAKGIRNSPSLRAIDLTGCSLTAKGAEVVAKIIKHQAMKRHNEAWQDSLRYRRPDLDRMSGIRRITLNTNPMMGDESAKLLADALKDDLWLKALDMQQCGLTDLGANSFLGTLKFNTCLIVLDIRQNPMTDHDLVKKIVEHLTINGYGADSEYRFRKFKWITAEPLQDPSKVKKKKRTKALQNGYGKRTTIKISSSNTPVGGRRRSRSCGNINTPSPDTKGLPWRTAQRANRHKGYPPDESPGKTHLELLAESPDNTTIRISPGHASDDDITMHGLRGTLSDTEVSTLKDMKSVQVEIEQLRRRLREETRARANAEERVIELTLDNNRLKGEVDDFRAKQGILDDDAVLDSIERSFQQFHQFLELLKDAGLGQLIQLAGIDQSAFNGQSNLDVTGLDAGSREARLLNLTNGVGANIPVSSPQEHQEPVFSDSFQDMVHQANAGHGVRYSKSSGGPVNRPTTSQKKTSQSATTLPTADDKNKFDSLYAKALQETEGALSKNSRPEAGDAGSRIIERKSGDEELSDRSHKSEHSSRSSQKSNEKQRPMVIGDLEEPRDTQTKHKNNEKGDHKSKNESDDSNIDEVLELSELSDADQNKNGIYFGDDRRF